MAAQEGTITGIWWDTNSCQYPLHIIQNISFPITTHLLAKFRIPPSANISSSTAYVCDSHINPESELNIKNAGFRLTMFSPGEKQNLEKKMITDIMLWTMENSIHQANIVLVTGDVESFTYTLTKLHERKFRVFVCSNNIYQTSIPEYCHSYLLWPHFLLSILEKIKLPCNSATTLLNPNFLHSLSINNSNQVSNSGNQISQGQGDAVNQKIVEKHETNAINMQDFRTWFIELVNNKEKGYDISQLAKDCEKSTGKHLDLKLLGCNRVLGLVRKCSDKVVVKEVKTGVNLAFPTPIEEACDKPTQNACPENTDLKAKKKASKGKKKKTSKGKKKAASKEDFNESMLKMLADGDFKEGLLLNNLVKEFADKSGGLVLDHKHLGFSKLSSLVSSLPFVCIKQHCDKPSQALVFPSTCG